MRRGSMIVLQAGGGQRVRYRRFFAWRAGVHIPEAVAVDADREAGFEAVAAERPDLAVELLARNIKRNVAHRGVTAARTLGAVPAHRDVRQRFLLSRQEGRQLPE